VALYKAMDAQRIERALSWRQAANEIWAQWHASTHCSSCDGSDDHPSISLRRRRPPRLFLRPDRVSGRDGISPRWEALDARRRERQLSWEQVAGQLRCTRHQLTGIRTARFAIGMRLAMRIVQWLDRPASAFINAAEW